MRDKCRVCGLPVFEPHTALVEVTQKDTTIRKAVFYGLHPVCANNWAYAEMKRLRAIYRDAAELGFSCKVEVDAASIQ